jgi:hypothetical protein
MTTIVTHLIAGLFVVATPGGTYLAADGARSRVRRAVHRRRTLRNGQLLARIREHYEATGTQW